MTSLYAYPSPLAAPLTPVVTMVPRPLPPALLQRPLNGKIVVLTLSFFSSAAVLACAHRFRRPRMKPIALEGQLPMRVDSLKGHCVPPLTDMQEMVNRPQRTPYKTVGAAGFAPTTLWMPAAIHPSSSTSSLQSILCTSPVTPAVESGSLHAETLDWMNSRSMEGMTVPLKRVETINPIASSPVVTLPKPAPVPEDNEERRCLERAKELLRRCILSSARLNQYRLLVLLGFGSFGVVVRAQAFGMDDLAIKIMRKAQIHGSRNCYDPHTSLATTLEIALLKHCPRHRNIVGYIDSWEDEECFYLVTELGGYPWDRQSLESDTADCDVSLTDFDRLAVATGNAQQPFQRLLIPKRGNNHSLAGFMRACGAWSDQLRSCGNREPVIKEQIQKTIMRQLVDAVRVLHQHGIVHRDLKDENVLLDADLRARLIDFGHAAFYNHPIQRPAIPPFKSYGTPLFSAPEVRSKQSYTGPEGDVYALGLMLYEMNYGDLPDNLDDAFYAPGAYCIFDISPRTGFQTAEVRDLCRWMLCPDPQHRATIQEVANHPWFQSV